MSVCGPWRVLTCSLIMHPTWLLYPCGWVLYPRRLLAFAGDPSRGGIRTGAIHYLFTYRLVESLWSSLTLISEFYDTLGETLATSLVTPTIAFFLSYKVENWLVFYHPPQFTILQYYQYSEHLVRGCMSVMSDSAPPSPCRSGATDFRFL